MKPAWEQNIPRLLHDARAILRKATTKGQLLQRHLAGNPDHEVQILLNSMTEAHLDLDRFLVRVGALAEAAKTGLGPPLPLRALVLGAQLATSASLASAGGTMEISPVPEYHISTKIQTALQELIDNSVRFRADGRPLVVSVEASLKNGVLRICHRDNGAGWDPEFSHQLFRPFERLDAKRGGFGLGLAITKTIVESMGGTVRAATSASGSEFTIEIPAASA